MAWLADNIGTIVVVLLLAVMVAAISIKLIKDRKKGKSLCGCNCAHCDMAGQCHRPAGSQKPDEELM